MPKIFLFSLESVPTRYTFQWKHHLPKILAEKTGMEVIDVDGVSEDIKASEGGFLNFVETNRFKGLQLARFVQMWTDGQVKDGDIVFFADAWNPAVLNVKYMADLAGVELKLVGLWHAGSYIAEDPLGQKIKNKSWSYRAEAAMFNALDVNVFATKWHRDHFKKVLGKDIGQFDGKAMVSGFPMEYINDIEFPEVEKEDLVIFPHRISPEKQVGLFKEIEKLCPGIKFVVCQESNPTKAEYHEMVARAKVMFSGALLETLGICQYEAMAGGCLPMVPDRLSYSEMYSHRLPFLYQSSWSEPGTWEVEHLAETIRFMVQEYARLLPVLPHARKKQFEEFFSADVLYDELKKMGGTRYG